MSGSVSFWIVLVFGNLAAILFVLLHRRTTPSPAQLRLARVIVTLGAMVGVAGFVVSLCPHSASAPVSAAPALVALPQAAPALH
jgi:hypothetical protein